MDNNMSGMINQLLSDPESLKKLMSMASALGLGQSSPQTGQQTASQDGNQTQPSQSDQSDDDSSAPAMAQPSQSGDGSTEALSRAVQALGSMNSAPAGGNDRHAALLMALKPYMRSQRQEKMDGAMKLLTAVKMFRNMGGGGV